MVNRTHDLFGDGMKNPKAGDINWDALEELVGIENVMRLKISAMEGFLTQETETEGSLLDWQKTVVKEVLAELEKIIDQVIEK